MRSYLLAAILTAVFSCAAVGIGFHGIYGREILAAQALSMMHGATALWITHRALRHKDHSFFLWGLGMNGIRVLVLLAVVIGISRADGLGFQPFVTAVLIGYFCFLFSEIGYLHMASIRSGHGNL